MEIPKEIRFEFTLLFGGLAMLILPFWLYLYKQDIFNQLMDSIIGFIAILLLLIAGVVLTIYGFSELTRNYFIKQDLFIRENRLAKYEIDKKLKKLPKEYISDIKFPETKKKKTKKK